MPKVNHTCPKCGKKCGNAGAFKIHIQTHDQKEPPASSLLRFLKRAPPKKFSIEMKPMKKEKKSKQVKLFAMKRPIPSGPRVNPLPEPPPPPRRPRSKPISDLNPFLAPDDLTAENLDEKSPQFRIAHVRG